MNVLDNSIYLHSLVFLGLFFLLAIVKKFNQSAVLEYGMHLLLLWMLIEFFFTLYSDKYWYDIGHMTIAFLILYSTYWILIIISGKFGSLYMGDGWLISLAPLTLYPLFIVFSLICRGIMLLWRYLF